MWNFFQKGERHSWSCDSIFIRGMCKRDRYQVTRFKCVHVRCRMQVNLSHTHTLHVPSVVYTMYTYVYRCFGCCAVNIIRRRQSNFLWSQRNAQWIFIILWNGFDNARRRISIPSSVFIPMRGSVVPTAAFHTHNSKFEFPFVSKLSRSSFKVLRYASLKFPSLKRKHTFWRNIRKLLDRGRDSYLNFHATSFDYRSTVTWKDLSD